MVLLYRDKETTHVLLLCDWIHHWLAWLLKVFANGNFRAGHKVSESQLFESWTLSIRAVNICRAFMLFENDTVESRYLELGNLEFCKTRSVYLNKKYILITFSIDLLIYRSLLSPTIIWRWRPFYKSKLPEVQIYLHFG